MPDGILDRAGTVYLIFLQAIFPADDPMYSCIVVIHKPDKKIGYYGKRSGQRRYSRK